jgi:Ser/Thr protein kinase RdoA (MazF antagonist)
MFGMFSARLKDYNARRLHITIPDFLNMEVRLRQLMIAHHASPEERLKNASEGFERILANQQISSDFIRMRLALPERVAHNDTRISNVLFSNHTGKGISVIDLDTVMTGTLLTDFGDMVRTFTRESGENETEGVRSNPVLFEAVLNGFMSVVHGFISEVEKANLLLGAKVMIYMQAVRFLTDYLNGDVYYKVTYPDQNLERAQSQLSLLESVLNQEDLLREIMKKNS